MKKLIALLLAVSSMAVSSSALAANYDSFELYPIGSNVSAEHKGISRNYTSSSVNGAGQANYGSPIFRAVGSAINQLPTYRSGDLITLALLCKNAGSVVKVNDGDVLTFICSKQNGASYENSTVQFIDQITLTPDANTSYVYCTYKLRDNLEDGRYKLEMRLNGISNTFEFLVATPSVELIYTKPVNERTGTKADKYTLENGIAQCFGKATITAGANFSQVDTDFGFVFDKDGDGNFETTNYIKETTRNGNELTADAADALTANVGRNEIGGQAQYFFRMVIDEVPSIDVLPDVNVYLNN